MVEQEKKAKLRIRDNPYVSEIYCNKFLFSGFDGGAVTLTFGNMRMIAERTDEGPKPGSHPEIFITQRLSLSPSAAVELINGLNTIMGALIQAQANAPKTATSH